jgi:hypothetical protein
MERGETIPEGVNMTQVIEAAPETVETDCSDYTLQRGDRTLYARAYRLDDYAVAVSISRDPECFAANADDDMEGGLYIRAMRAALPMLELVLRSAAYESLECLTVNFNAEALQAVDMDNSPHAVLKQ